jgi:hypothetical protein
MEQPPSCPLVPSIPSECVREPIGEGVRLLDVGHVGRVVNHV